VAFLAAPVVSMASWKPLLEMIPGMFYLCFHDKIIPVLHCFAFFCLQHSDISTTVHVPSYEAACMQSSIAELAALNLN
jgi:hypothetical protein